MSAPAGSSTTQKEIDLIQRLDEERKRGLGLLLVDVEAKRMQLPLAGVDIKAQIADRVAQVTVKETFRNPHQEHLEAVYIFPLAPQAAISSFEMRVKDRVIKGKVDERSQARMEYQQAITDGKRAALLEQERDDVFTVQVGNLPPGEEITVVVTYSERLPFFENGSTEVRLPLVVAPRYIPGQALERDSVGAGVELDTDLVPDASRITPPRLAEGFDPKVALNIQVELLSDTDDANSGSPSSGYSISDLACSQHAIRTALGSSGVKVALARENELLNRDFVLRWTLCASGVKTSLISCTDESDSNVRYGMLSILPPKREGFLGVPRDVIFVLDRSGSMGGVKMTSAVKACSILLNTLGPRDRYAIVAFDSVNEWFKPAGNAADFYFLQADEPGIEQGEKFLRTITARGGTEIYSALNESLQLVARTRQDSECIPVIAVLTDGEIGDESRVLKGIQKTLGDCRIFTVGIDTAVNAGFLTRLASIGGGTCSFVQPGSQLETALSNVAREIGAPVVTDLEIIDDGVGLDSSSLAPNRLPDLFAGRASTCFFKFKPGKKAQLKIRGKLAGGGKFEETVKPQAMPLGAIAQLWAKQHIVDLEDQFRINPSRQTELRKQIIAISVKHSLLTKFTAFVVVDHSEIVNAGGTTKQVVQPVENPEGWDMCKQADLSNGAAAVPRRASSSLMGQLVRQRQASDDSAGDAPLTLAESIRCKSVAPEPKAKAEADGRLQASYDTPVPRSDEAAAQAAPSPQAWGSPPASPPPPPASPPPGQSASKKQSCFKLPQDSPQFEIQDRSLPPASAAGAGTGGGGGVFNALGRLASGFMGRPDAQGDSAKSEHDSGQIENAVKTLQEFAEALESVWSELEKGTVPKFENIEKARRQLMDALASISLGEKVPLLQKFLRNEAVELIAALKSAKTTQGLDTIVKRHKAAFQKSLDEATAAIESAGGSSKPFWEGSI